MRLTILTLAAGMGLALLGAGTAHVQVDFDRPNGTIRAINGGNLGPDFHCGRLRGDGVTEFRQLKVPSTRLHDVPLATRGQRVVDTHFIFPLQHLDPKDPRNYYFKATDDYLAVLRRIGTEPYFRLGTSIEHAIGSYNAVMPENFEHFAEVCCGIIRHYNKGWANGYNWNIRYWEIWNEPDIGKPMWNGSMLDYCRLYEIVSKKIKAEFPEVKVGGPVICRFHPTEKNPGKPDDVGHVFMQYCRDHDCPLDFFAWHRYDSALPGILAEPAQMRKFVDSFGYTKAELILNEWHYWVGGFSPRAYSDSKDGLAGVNAAVFAPAVLTGWQDSPLTMGHHYTIGPLSGYWGAWRQTGDEKMRFKLFYTLRYFAKMLAHPNRVAVTSDQLNVQVLAGRNGKGRRAVLVSNFKSGMDTIELTLKGAPNTRFRRLTTDADHDEARDGVTTDANGKLVLKGVPSDLSSCMYLVEADAESVEEGWRIVGTGKDAYAAPAVETPDQTAQAFQKLDRTYADGVLRLTADVLAPEAWAGQPTQGTTLRVGLSSDERIDATHWGVIGEFGPDLQADRQSHAFALTRKGTSFSGRALGVCAPKTWYRYVAEYDLAKGVYTVSVSEAATGKPFGKLEKLAFSRPFAKERPISAIALKAHGVASVQDDAFDPRNAGGVDNLKLEWKAPGAADFATVMTCDFATRTGVAAGQPMGGAKIAAKPVVTVDFAKRTGPVKPMHGVGQPPQIGWDYRLFHYLKDAGIPYSRLHDVGGHHGKDAYVDIPNVFRNFDADENDPKSYDFAFTDHLLKNLAANNVEPFYRLGITIENRVDIKPHRTFPPKDPAKWARICEHVIRHYTEGWANGFTYRITYWEIWNEPESDLNKVGNHAMWYGSWNQYMDLYEVTSKHLKKCFPHLKIGGYAGCGFYGAGEKLGEKKPKCRPNEALYVDCFLQFLDRVKEKNCPLDFYSFHTYSNPKEALRQINWGIATLHQKGFTNVETIVNEWLPHVGHDNLGTALQASAICAEMIGMQHSKLDAAMIYDARCGIGNYSPLFNPMTYKPHKAYYALKAFNEAYRLKNAVATETAHGNVSALAAGDATGGVLLVANTAKTAVPFRPELGSLRMQSCLLTDDDHTYEEVPIPDQLPPLSFMLIRVGRD